MQTRIRVGATFKWRVTNGSLRGVWPPFLEIGLFHSSPPFLPFLCLFCPFPALPVTHLGIPSGAQKRRLFPHISSDLPKSPPLKLPFFSARQLFEERPKTRSGSGGPAGWLRWAVPGPGWTKYLHLRTILGNTLSFKLRPELAETSHLEVGREDQTTWQSVRQPKFGKLGSTPTPWSGPFQDHGLRPWSQSPSEHCKPYA